MKRPVILLSAIVLIVVVTGAIVTIGRHVPGQSQLDPDRLTAGNVGDIVLQHTIKNGAWRAAFTPDGVLKVLSNDGLWTFSDLDSLAEVMNLPPEPSVFEYTDASGRALSGTLYNVPIDGQMRQLAMVREGRSESQFIDPADMEAGVIVWQGEWRTLTEVNPALETFISSDVFIPHHEPRKSIAAFSPDRTLIFWDGPGVTAVWDTVNKQEYPIERASFNGFMSGTFSPDGKLLALGYEDGTIKLLDTATWTEAAVLEKHGVRVRHLVFSPDGRWLVSSSDNGTVRLWNMDDGAARHVLPLVMDSGVNPIVFSPDSRRMATFSADHILRIWDVERGAEISQFENILSFALSPDWSLLALVNNTIPGSNYFKFFDVDTQQQVATVPIVYSAYTLAFSPDGSRLMQYEYGEVQLWGLPR